MPVCVLGNRIAPAICSVYLYVSSPRGKHAQAVRVATSLCHAMLIRYLFPSRIFLRIDIAVTLLYCLSPARIDPPISLQSKLQKQIFSDNAGHDTIRLPPSYMSLARILISILTSSSPVDIRLHRHFGILDGLLRLVISLAVGHSVEAFVVVRTTRPHPIHHTSAPSDHAERPSDSTSCQDQPTERRSKCIASVQSPDQTSAKSFDSSPARGTESRPALTANIAKRNSPAIQTKHHKMPQNDAIAIILIVIFAAILVIGLVVYWLTILTRPRKVIGDKGRA